MTPFFALLVSMGFEGYQPNALTFVGAALAFAGNFLILRPGAGRNARYRFGKAVEREHNRSAIRNAQLPPEE